MRRLRAWWRARHAHVDECETCAKQLTAREAFELRSYPDDDAELLEGGLGGTWMSATYCRAHFPAGRTPHRRNL